MADSPEIEDDGQAMGQGASADVYDVVVVGAGIGGLTAAALLAHAGKKVLVVEAEGQPGGYARALRREAYVFDRADHLIMGCEESGPFGPGLVDAVLRHLGVRDRCEFVRMDDPIYVAQLPDLRVAVPHGQERYLEAHLRHFPAEAGGLRRLTELSAEIARELAAFPMQPRGQDLLLSPRRFPQLYRHGNATTKQVVDRELSDPRLRAVYNTLWAWIGPPPARASFLMWAWMMASYVEEGAYYCRGSFQQLADALVTALEEAGGGLLLSSPVTRILTQARRVEGVELAGGHQVRAPLVVSNIDARETFEQLLDPAVLPPRFLRRLRAMEASGSLVVLYAATDLDVRALGAAHDTTVSTEWDEERLLARALAGEVPGLSVLIPTLKDPALAPPGEHLVILKALASAPAAGVSLDERVLAERMLERAEEVLPGLRQHLTFVDETAAAGGERSPLHHLDPVYGWAATPAQSGYRRLAPQTPIHGLLLAGHWTQPGHGITPVVQSGLGAARHALGAPVAEPALPLRV